jgi:hypothetical protein
MCNILTKQCVLYILYEGSSRNIYPIAIQLFSCPLYLPRENFKSPLLDMSHQFTHKHKTHINNDNINSFNIFLPCQKPYPSFFALPLQGCQSISDITFYWYFLFCTFPISGTRRRQEKECLYVC